MERGQSNRFTWEAGAVPATLRLFRVQVDNDRLWQEARVPLERRKRTSRDIILLCPQGFWGRIGKYRGVGRQDTVGTASGNACAFKVVCVCV